MIRTRLIRLRCLTVFMLGWGLGVQPTALWAQEAAAPEEVAEPAATQAATSQEWPDLTIPQEATLEQLEAVVATAQKLRPSSPQQYQAMQTAIRDASKQIMARLDGQKSHPRYQQAELDTMSSSIALMTYFGQDAQQKTLEQVHQFLNSRKQLSLQDVQLGMLAAAMLELQPHKQPARDTYALLDKLLADDEREEMQNLRLNLQASVRRLELLGNPLKLQATALDGKRIDIADYAGKYVLVDFFATWCEPCLAEIPRIQRHYEQYHERGLEVIGISLDAEADDLQQYLKRVPLPWPVVHDNASDPLERLQMTFGIAHLPTVLLLNKEGTVVSLEARGAELERLMQMLFEAPTPAATAAAPDAEAPAARSVLEPSATDAPPDGQ